jgi:RNA polymerase sigma-70 factor, ECF subfamily
MEDQNEDPWRNWFARHGAKLLLCARQWTRSAADAEDVLQEAFIRFWKNQRALRGDPLALVLTSIRRAAFDLARRDQRRQAREHAAQAPEEVSWFEPLPEHDDRRVVIEEALRRLPAEQRQVLVLRIWGECSFEAIAQQLGIPANTAASRYRYALAALRKELVSPKK